MSARMKLGRDDCPNVEQHSSWPIGYLAWHEWVEKMVKTHHQIRCSGCGLWAIWIPKTQPAPRYLTREKQG